jgi:hypothetical protein
MFGGLMFHYLVDFRKPAFQKPIFTRVQHLLLDHLALRTSQPCETSGRHGFDIARRRAVLSFQHHAEVAAAVLAAGGRVGAARTVDEVLLLDSWGIPRARRVQVAV